MFSITLPEIFINFFATESQFE